MEIDLSQKQIDKQLAVCCKLTAKSKDFCLETNDEKLQEYFYNKNWSVRENIIAINKDLKQIN